MRAGVFAAVCVALSQVGHDLMAARPARLWVSWVALAGVGAVGYCLADRRRPAWWILLAVQVAQVCLHVWFSCCTPSGPATGPVHMQMRAGGMHAAGSLAVSHGTGASLGMFGAHVLAGCLWRALRVVAGFLVDRTLRVLILLLNAALPISPGPVRVTVGRVEDEPPPKVAVLRHVLVRRGPPRAGGLPAFA
jgi:hypothetical protein